MNKNREILIYDTTLRDGTQGEGVSFTIDDKIKIVHELDKFGVHYIECGWPGSNPKDMELFDRLKSYKPVHTKITAFGSTFHPKNTADTDSNLNALIASCAKTITIFGKTWDLHVKFALKVSNQKNLELIKESIHFLKKHHHN